jgi:ketosteroid isomerase-like protein
MTAQHVELVRKGTEAFAARDVDWVIEHSTPEVEWYPAVAGGVQGKPYRGHPGLREFFKELQEVWEEFRLEPEEYRDLGDHVLVLAKVHAKGRGGVVFDQSLDSVWEMRDGKIARGRSYLSREAALRAAAEVAGREVAT